MFFVTKREFYSIRPEVLQSRAMMEEIRQTCTAIEAEIGETFYATTRQAENRMPNLNDFVGDYWKLRYPRTLQSWRTSKLPVVVTHKLVNETGA